MDRSIRSGGIFGRQRAYRRRLCLSGRLGLMVAALVFVPATVFAKSVEEKPTGYAMMADLLVARPLGVVLAGVSSVFYVVTPPFSLAGGNAREAGVEMVLEPGREVFVRCLGCRRVGRLGRVVETATASDTIEDEATDGGVKERLGIFRKR